MPTPTSATRAVVALLLLLASPVQAADLVFHIPDKLGKDEGGKWYGKEGDPAAATFAISKQMEERKDEIDLLVWLCTKLRYRTMKDAGITWEVRE